MGLDNYASRSPGEVELTAEDQQAFAQASIELCGGFWSGGDGGSSFRGKVYVAVVARVAGASLTKEWVPPEEVGEIAAAFERCDSSRVVEESKGDAYPVTGLEVLELRRILPRLRGPRARPHRLVLRMQIGPARAATLHSELDSSTWFRVPAGAQ